MILAQALGVTFAAIATALLFAALLGALLRSRTEPLAGDWADGEAPRLRGTIFHSSSDSDGTQHDHA